MAAHVRFSLPMMLLTGVLSLCPSARTAAGADHRAEPTENDSIERFSMLQIRFGIPIEISCYAESPEKAKAAFNAAFAEAKRLDGIFSDYDPDSEARRLAALPAGQWHPASSDLLRVCNAARRVTAVSQGAFDISVGPLTHQWRKTMRSKRHPDTEVLASVLAKVGNDRWAIKENAIYFNESGMRLDFGGIAKGYALDQMALVLRRHQINQYLIDAGGDLICGDSPPEREFWRIEIERPKSTPRDDAAETATTGKPMVLRIANRAVATSGASYQSVTLDGKRYSHIVDPRTGYGVPFLANVTVEAKTGLVADALASAISVLGEDRAKGLLSNNMDIRFTITQPNGERRTFPPDGNLRGSHQGDD